MSTFLSDLWEAFYDSFMTALIVTLVSSVIATFWQPIFLFISIATTFFNNLGWFGYVYLFIGIFVSFFIYYLYKNIYETYRALDARNKISND